MIKPICFYLPQFHEFNENNLWWGKGFTEWTCVKNAKSLIPEHIIKHPHEDIGYYCLLDINIRKKQAELAKMYGVYGFCYYHYWFGGKVLMQASLELMLQDGEPDLPFCLSWANEPWTRKMNGGNGELLQPQFYGGVEEWDAHLQYLLKFFKNKNYILIDNKPVLLIYRIGQITNYKERFNYWKEEIKKYGFDGLFIAMTLGVFSKNESIPILPHVDGVVDFYPNFLREPDIVSYIDNNIAFCDINYAWKRILKEPQIHERHFKGMMVGFDSSPRSPKIASVFINGNPKTFGAVLSRQIENSKEDFIFINAWNEWGEQACLEPDTYYGYDYLKSLKNSVMRKWYA